MAVISTAQPREKMVIGNELKKYTVWVGGTEVTDHLITYTSAKLLLDTYEKMGHKDVVIQGVRSDE